MYSSPRDASLSNTLLKKEKRLIFTHNTCPSQEALIYDVLTQRQGPPPLQLQCGRSMAGKERIRICTFCLKDFHQETTPDTCTPILLTKVDHMAMPKFKGKALSHNVLRRRRTKPQLNHPMTIMEGAEGGRGWAKEEESRTYRPPVTPLPDDAYGTMKQKVHLLYVSSTLTFLWEKNKRVKISCVDANFELFYILALLWSGLGSYLSSSYKPARQT